MCQENHSINLHKPDWFIQQEDSTKSLRSGSQNEAAFLYPQRLYLVLDQGKSS